MIRDKVSYAKLHWRDLLSPIQRGPLSLVEECRGLALIGREMLLRQLSYAIYKEPAQGTKSPLLGVLEQIGVFFLPFAGSF